MAELYFSKSEYDQMKEIIGNLMEFCPNLKQLNINVTFVESDHDFEVKLVLFSIKNYF
jgi:hypothetical protein